MEKSDLSEIEIRKEPAVPYDLDVQEDAEKNILKKIRTENKNLYNNNFEKIFKVITKTI